MRSKHTSKKSGSRVQDQLEAWSQAGAVFAEFLDICAQSKLAVASVVIIPKCGDAVVYYPARLSKTSGCFDLRCAGPGGEAFRSKCRRRQCPENATSPAKSSRRS